MTRYEIREIDVSHTPGFLSNVRRYIVWDREASRRVPFGIYLTRADAEARVTREETRNG